MDEEKIIKIITMWVDCLDGKNDLELDEGFVLLLKKAVEDILELYKKKNRMVELMAEHLTTELHDKNWVIKYFENEVELENESQNDE